MECKVKDMDSLLYKVGKAFLPSLSPVAELPWSVIFEDEGSAAYFYACDRRREQEGDGWESSVLDAMLVYNTASMEEPERERLATLEWSRDGLRAVLRLDGIPQVLVDFKERCGYCRSNFPNFMEDQRGGWRTASHAWSDEAMAEFEKETIFQ